MLPATPFVFVIIHQRRLTKNLTFRTPSPIVSNFVRLEDTLPLSRTFRSYPVYTSETQNKLPLGRLRAIRSGRLWTEGEGMSSKRKIFSICVRPVMPDNPPPPGEILSS